MTLASIASTGHADALAPVPPRAELFSLGNVRLLDGPFLTAQQTDRDYLLQLEPDRLLAGFRAEAGLPPKGQRYPGWESLGVAGHSLGHYLSALSAMWQATGDERLHARVAYIVDELAACQDANGYVSAIPGGGKIFAEIAAGHITTKSPFDLNGGWVPWYTTHKVFAGLIDAYQRAGSEKARSVAVRLADWCGTVVEKLDDPQMQQMLSTEHGGMAESLAEISAFTGDGKYLALAKKFRHAAVFDPLARSEDHLTGLHANTQIPKMIGYDRIYELTGDESYGMVARNFWKFVVHDRSFATGGHGTHENFFNPARFRENMLQAVGPETCNTYNMLKLTERLFTEHPSVELIDYYERALYNHILGSQVPLQPGALTYYTSMRPGAFHTYCKPFGDFWCCVGTGMENHARYGDIIYAHTGDDKLFVNLFIPSELRWQEMMVRQETRFPADEQTQLVFSALPEPKTFTVTVRCPGWTVPGGMDLRVNGEPVAAARSVPGQYAEVRREWKNGDVLTVNLPLQIRTETLPHAEGFAAIFYGPVLLAGDLGRDGLKDGDFFGQMLNEQKELPAAQVPVLLASVADIPGRLQPVADRLLTFRFPEETLRPRDVILRPFYELAGQRYAVYWRLTTPEKYAQEVRVLEQAEQHERELAARTYDRLTPGEQQPDVDHHLKTENSRTGMAFERRYRDAWDGGWFSYEMKVPPDRPVKVFCTYWDGETVERRFDLLVDDRLIASQELHNNQPGKFFDVETALPEEVTRGKNTVTIRFQAVPHGVAGGVFDLRIVQ